MRTHRADTRRRCATLLRRANAVAQRRWTRGHHPFGALLVAPDGETVLLEQGNVDSVNHAEAVLAREAARRFSARAPVGLHAGHHRRALRDVRRHAVLGAHRPRWSTA